MMSYLFRLPVLLSLLCLTFFSQASTVQPWPRTVPGAKGDVQLSHQPERILSTSVTLTGLLLAIDAPVVASSVAQPGGRLADEQGFFRQWGEVARAKGVKPLPAGEASLEAIAALQPDLIVVSSTGKDSAVGLYDRLTKIAPTLVVDYDQQSWQQITLLLGKATGRDVEASNLIQAFNQRAEAVRKTIKLPPQPVSALVFNARSRVANLWTRDSAQGRLLESLGFTLAMPPSGIKGMQLPRKDIVSLSGENLVTGITGQSVLMFAADESGKSALLAEPLLSASPAVRKQQVYTLGNDSFRLDYYSSLHLLTRLEALFARREG